MPLGPEAQRAGRRRLRPPQARAGLRPVAEGPRRRAHAAPLADDAVPYARLRPLTASRVEIVPTVDAARRTAWLTVAGTNPALAYRGRLTIDLAGLGLPAGTYHLVDVASRRVLPATASRTGLTLALRLARGAFHVWRLVPGAG